MAGWAACADTFNLRDKGVLYTREIVMLVSRIDGGAVNYPVMTEYPLDWFRLENASSRWTSTEALDVVDYRIPPTESSRHTMRRDGQMDA